MNTEQINALFDEWKRTQDWFYKEPIHYLDQKDCEQFAAYCLSKREPEG